MPSPKPAIRYPLGKLCGFVVSTKMEKTVCRRASRAPRGPAVAAAPSAAAPMRARAHLFACWQVVVKIPYLLWNFKMQTQVKRNTKIWAHDEYELANEGDVVRCDAATCVLRAGCVGACAERVCERG